MAIRYIVEVQLPSGKWQPEKVHEAFIPALAEYALSSKEQPTRLVRVKGSIERISGIDYFTETQKRRLVRPLKNYDEAIMGDDYLPTSATEVW